MCRGAAVSLFIFLLSWSLVCKKETGTKGKSVSVTLPEKNYKKCNTIYYAPKFSPEKTEIGFGPKTQAEMSPHTHFHSA